MYVSSIYLFGVERRVYYDIFRAEISTEDNLTAFGHEFDFQSGGLNRGGTLIQGTEVFESAD